MRVEVKQQVEVDVCPRHGLWLDKDELDVIASVIESRHRSSERILRRSAVRVAKREGKTTGAFSGWWSLLY